MSKASSKGIFTRGLEVDTVLTRRYKAMKPTWRCLELVIARKLDSDAPNRFRKIRKSIRSAEPSFESCCILYL